MKNALKKIAVSTASAGMLLSSAASAVFAVVDAGGGGAGGGLSTPKGFATDLGTAISGILSFVMVIAALLVLFYLILGGIEWITSGGDKGKTESARNKITAAVIGIIILAAAFAVTQVVLRFLGFSNLNDALTGGTTIRGGDLNAL